MQPALAVRCRSEALGMNIDLSEAALSCRQTAHGKQRLAPVSAAAMRGRSCQAMHAKLLRAPALKWTPAPPDEHGRTHGVRSAIAG